MGNSVSQGLDKSIFRAYDIRGIYPIELDESGAYKIARAIFEYARPKKVAIGRDARLSSPAIHKAVCRGFADAGCEVLDCGMTGTDVMSWAAGAKDFDITISVTASHNPKEWIGMKVFERGGASVGGAGEIKAIGKIAENIRDINDKPSDVAIAPIDLLDEWIEHVLSFIDPKSVRPFKIVVDAGNGVAGPIVKKLFKRLPVQLVDMYFDPDGNFPHHLPSPIEPKNVADLQKRVVEEGADLGMAFDGDADRLFLIDEKGGIVTGSEMVAMVLDEILSQDPGRVVLHNEVCGWNVRDVIAKYGAEAYPTLTGIGFIKKDMAKRNAHFCGEHSGHYYFKDNYNCDSGLIAGVFVLALLSKSNKPLSEMLAPHRKYVAIPETNFRVQDVEQVLKQMERRYSHLSVRKFDGLTIVDDDWWCNVRPSSNEPLLRLNVEAKNKTTLKKVARELTELITQSVPASA